MISGSILPKLTRDQLADELTRMVLPAYFPLGCMCATSRQCGWCANYQRTRVKILKMVNRLEAQKNDTERP